MSKRIDKQTVHFINSTYLTNKTKTNDVVIVHEKVKTKYTDGSVEYDDRLNTIENPKRSFYITKPNHRNHTLKKMCEHVDNLKKFTCRNIDLAKKLGEATGQYSGYGRPPYIRDLFNNPYVYGADIDIQVLIKRAYDKQCGDEAVKLVYGSADIEKVSDGAKEIPVASFISGQTIYTCVLKSFMYEGEGARRKAVDEDYLRGMVFQALDKFFEIHGQKLKTQVLKDHPELFNDKDQIPFDLVLKSFDSELEMLTWYGQMMQQSKTDFVGFWNIDYDMRQLAERVEILGGDPRKVFCSQEIPERYQKFVYKADRSNSKQKAHIVDKWHTVECSGYCTFYDEMCLYGRARKQNGRETSYSLNYTASQILGASKLSFGRNAKLGYVDLYVLNDFGYPQLAATAEDQKSGKVVMYNGVKLDNSYNIEVPLMNSETGKTVVSQNDLKYGLYNKDNTPIEASEDGHNYMAHCRFPEYVAYNVIDCLLPQLMCWLNQDPDGALGLIEHSMWSDYDKQSVILKNNFYDEFLDDDYVLASSGSKDLSEVNSQLNKAGGTVLDPIKAANIGIYCAKEYPQVELMVHKYVSDLDASSMYPSIIQLCNMSKDTKSSTVISIEGFTDAQVEDLFNAHASPISASVPVCVNHFGLPSYAEMDALWCKENGE